MIAITDKSKQFLVFTIKVLIVSAAFYFIYNQLATNDQLNWGKFAALFEKKWTHFWYTIFVNQDLRFKTEPQITSFVYYPYFERYVLTLKEQKYVLQNDRIC